MVWRIERRTADCHLSIASSLDHYGRIGHDYVHDIKVRRRKSVKGGSYNCISSDGRKLNGRCNRRLDKLVLLNIGPVFVILKKGDEAGVLQ